MAERVTLAIRRQPAEGGPAHWDHFELSLEGLATVADALAAINEDPKTRDGRKVPRVSWDDACGWPSCGVCTMGIASRARDACATALREVAVSNKPLVLTPLRGFRVVRDLVVDRARIADDLRRFEPWGDAKNLAFSACTRCGACIDACPSTGLGRPYVGAVVVGLSHPARDASNDATRREALVTTGGIAECGGAEACVEICPEGVPLGEALSVALAEATRHAMRTMFTKKK
ncbi:MAG: 2Fe-2S iron-sulfur cluster-binding protein [Polyangiaceae bacterium]